MRLVHSELILRRYKGSHTTQGRVIPALPFFTPAANYNNRTDVLCSALYVLLIFNEEVHRNTKNALQGRTEPQNRCSAMRICRNLKW